MPEACYCGETQLCAKCWTNPEIREHTCKWKDCEEYIENSQYSKGGFVFCGPLCEHLHFEYEWKKNLEGERHEPTATHGASRIAALAQQEIQILEMVDGKREAA